jgi:hypothetical protein
MRKRKRNLLMIIAKKKSLKRKIHQVKVVQNQNLLKKQEE